MEARIVLGLVACALLSACGGGGGGTSPVSTTPPTPVPPASPPPSPAPTNDAAAYQGAVESSVRVALLVDHATKTLLGVPEKIAAEVNAHGAFAHCNDSTCQDQDRSHWYTISPVDAGSVRVHDWQEVVNPNGVLDGPDTLEADLLGIGAAPTVTTTARLYLPQSADRPFAMAFTADPDLTRGGLLLGGSKALELQGNLSVLLKNSRYEIRDHRLDEQMDRQLIVAEYAQGQTTASWLTNYVALTNATNLDALDFDIDMVNYFGGAKRKLKTIASLDFASNSGQVVLEAGSFRYEYEDASHAKHFVLLVSVDSDPAYLLVRIDEDVDGTYEKSGRLAQTSMTYLSQ